MPSASAPSLFIFLMTTVFHDNKTKGGESPTAIAWHDPEVVQKMKIGVPSISPNDKPPEYLTTEDSKAIAAYIEYLKGLPIDKKLEEIEHGQQLSVQKTTYRTWYTKAARQCINTAVDTVLMELECHPTQIIASSQNDDFPIINVWATRAASNGGPLLFGAAAADGVVTVHSAMAPLISFFVHALNRLKKEKDTRLEKTVMGEESSLTQAQLLYDRTYLFLAIPRNLLTVINIEIKDQEKIPTKTVREILPLPKKVRKVMMWFPATTEGTLDEMREFFEALIESHTGEQNTTNTTVREPKNAAAKTKSKPYL